jgi:2-hydroxychromene-2-carboxylate isomerase
VVAGTAYPGVVLVLHFDYPSAASAVAVLRLQRLADEGVAVGFTGVDSLGLEVAVPVPPQRRDEAERCRAAAAGLGLELGAPSRWPPTLRAHLLGELADDLGQGGAWRRDCLDAYWCRDADLDDEQVLRGLAQQVGLDPSAVEQRLTDRALRVAARRRALTRRRRGVGGVPVIEVHGTLVPPDLADDALRALAAS